MKDETAPIAQDEKQLPTEIEQMEDRIQPDVWDWLGGLTREPGTKPAGESKVPAAQEMLDHL